VSTFRFVEELFGEYWGKEMGAQCGLGRDDEGCGGPGRAGQGDSGAARVWDWRLWDWCGGDDGMFPMMQFS